MAVIAEQYPHKMSFDPKTGRLTCFGGVVTEIAQRHPIFGLRGGFLPSAAESGAVGFSGVVGNSGGGLQAIKRDSYYDEPRPVEAKGILDVTEGSLDALSPEEEDALSHYDQIMSAYCKGILLRLLTEYLMLIEASNWSANSDLMSLSTSSFATCFSRYPTLKKEDDVWVQDNTIVVNNMIIAGLTFSGTIHEVFEYSKAGIKTRTIESDNPDLLNLLCSIPGILIDKDKVSMQLYFAEAFASEDNKNLILSNFRKITLDGVTNPLALNYALLDAHASFLAKDLPVTAEVRNLRSMLQSKFYDSKSTQQDKLAVLDALTFLNSNLPELKNVTVLEKQKTCLSVLNNIINVRIQPLLNDALCAVEKANLTREHAGELKNKIFDLCLLAKKVSPQRQEIFCKSMGKLADMLNEFNQGNDAEKMGKLFQEFLTTTNLLNSTFIAFYSDTAALLQGCILLGKDVCRMSAEKRESVKLAGVDDKLKSDFVSDHPTEGNCYTGFGRPPRLW